MPCRWMWPARSLLTHIGWGCATCPSISRPFNSPAASLTAWASGWRSSAFRGEPRAPSCHPQSSPHSSKRNERCPKICSSPDLHSCVICVPVAGNIINDLRLDHRRTGLAAQDHLSTRSIAVQGVRKRKPGKNVRLEGLLRGAGIWILRYEKMRACN